MLIIVPLNLILLPVHLLVLVGALAGRLLVWLFIWLFIWLFSRRSGADRAGGGGQESEVR